MHDLGLVGPLYVSFEFFRLATLMLLFWLSIALLFIHLNRPVLSPENPLIISNIVFDLRGFGARVTHLALGMGGNSFEQDLVGTLAKML